MATGAGSSKRALRSVPPGRNASNRHDQPRPSLVGREADIESLVGLLDEHRLITLTGTGGIGKTVLASALAERVAATTSTSTLEVVLTGVQQPELVLATVVSAAGWRSSDDPFDTIVEQVGNHPALIVMDNVEQVIAAGSVFARLVEACPELRLVVTSRAPLRVAGETVHPVEPLDVPSVSPIVTPQTVAEAAAVRLFVDRAQQVDPGFGLSSANAATVANLCRRLDGIPLAIELAAARMDVVSPGALAAILAERPDVLRSRQRALTDERHRTLRATIGWSYELLDDELRRVLRCTAVFAGGFGLDALARVADIDQLAAIDSLGELIDHGLVRRMRSSDATAQADHRYATFEVIRQFAHQELTASGEVQPAADAHTRWCAELVERAAGQLGGTQAAEAMAVLEADIDNVRAALRRTIDTGQLATGVVIASKMRPFWWFRGTSSEGKRWLDEFLDTAPELSPELHAAALYARGQLAQEAGHNTSALSDLDQAAAMYADLDRPAELAAAWNALAFARRSLGELDAAEELHQRVLSLDGGAELARAHAVAENGLAAVAYYRNDMATAANRWQTALDTLRSLQDQRGVSQALSNLGVARLALGDPPGAIAAHAEAGQIARAAGDTNGLLYTLVNLVEDHLVGGDLDAADTHLAEVTELAERCGDRYVRAAAHVSTGQLAHRRGHTAAAFAELGAALSLYRALATDIDIATTLELLGLVCAAAAQPEASGFFTLAESLRASTSSTAPEHHHEALRAARQRSTDLAGSTAPMTSLDEAEANARMLADRCTDLTTALPISPAVGDSRWAAVGLTHREAEVALLVANWATDPEIAAELFISRRTVSSHVSALLRKLGVRSRRLVRRSLIEHGLLDGP